MVPTTTTTNATATTSAAAKSFPVRIFIPSFEAT
jgi:hypothetical protein